MVSQDNSSQETNRSGGQLVKRPASQQKLLILLSLLAVINRTSMKVTFCQNYVYLVNRLYLCCICAWVIMGASN
jgi:hypothetical protein